MSEPNSRKNLADIFQTKSLPGNSILQKFTSQDTGLISVPRLTPHLQFHTIDQHQTLLISETFNTLLNGEILSSLLPLLDGNRSRHEICSELDGRYSNLAIEQTLITLAARGYIVSGEYTLDEPEAAYWTSLGASPCWSQQRLSTYKLSIHGDDRGILTRQIQSTGISVTSHSERLSIYVCADYIENHHAEINRNHLKSGVPWMLIKPNGILPLFGPIFQPEKNGPCWACLAYRLQAHQEVHNFLRNLTGDQSVFLPQASQPSVSNAFTGLAAAEIAKWRVFDELSSLNNHVISIDTKGLHTERHLTNQRPQCVECGHAQLIDPNRQPLPVELKSSPKLVNNSGGTRAVSPEQTLKKYRHLVSPISGVVTWLKLNTNESDPWLHVHSSGSNYALRNNKLSSLRRSLRSKTVGKGSTKEQSEASALCEAIERYSCALHGDEIRCRKSLSEFLDSDNASAIHPNEMQLFSDHQIDNAREINARNHPFNIVPDKFDEHAVIDWSPVWSLTKNRHQYLPTSILYAMFPENRDLANLASDSNGCAAGIPWKKLFCRVFWNWLNAMHLRYGGTTGCKCLRSI